jgi:hypothetical protein
MFRQKNILLDRGGSHPPFEKGFKEKEGVSRALTVTA